MSDHNEEGVWEAHMMYEIQAKFGGCCVCFFILCVYDALFSRGKPGRWFEIHAAANAFVSLWALPAIVTWLVDPLGSLSTSLYPVPAAFSTDPVEFISAMFHPSSLWPAFMINAVHTYHVVIFFNELTSSDWFHHIMFVPIIGVGGGLFLETGPVRNVLSFFISGLPGGIDYAMLALVKRGKMTKMTEKRWMSWLNVWVREPGLLLVSFTGYCGWIYGYADDGLPAWTIFLLIFFIVFNAIYYSEMAIGNYYTRAQQTGDMGRGC
eukprot:Rmarinus@m.2498